MEKNTKAVAGGGALLSVVLGSVGIHFWNTKVAMPGSVSVGDSYQVFKLEAPIAPVNTDDPAIVQRLDDNLSRLNRIEADQKRK